MTEPAIPYDLIMPSASRPHLLRRVLASYFEYADQLPRRLIVHDDAVFPGRRDDVMRVVEECSAAARVAHVVHHDDPPLNHGPSVNWLLQRAETDYVLYGQDDHIVTRMLPLRDALLVMHEHGANNIRFNKRPTMDMKGTFRKKVVERTLADGRTFALCVADHWYFQTGLWRRRVARLVTEWFMTHTDAFAEHCVVGTTLVDTPRGFVAIQDLAAGLLGSEVYVYAYSVKKRRIVLAKAKDFRKTRDAALVWKLTCDDGTYLIATPDHKIMLRSGKYCRLDALKPGDSLMPLYRGYRSIMVRDGDERTEHRFVQSELYGARSIKDRDVNHKDRNRCNNDPSNLETLTRSAHMRKTEPEQRRKVWKKSRAAMRRCWADPEWRARMPHFDPKWQRRQSRRQRLARSNRAYWLNLKKNDPAKYRRWLDHLAQIRKKRWARPGERDRARARMIGNSFVRNAHNHKVLTVEPWGLADVYNLDVAQHHNFVANGLVVHNCETKFNNALNRGVAEFNWLWKRSGFGEVVTLPPTHSECMNPDVREVYQKTFIWGRPGDDRYISHIGDNPDDWALIRARGGVDHPRDSQRHA